MSTMCEKTRSEPENLIQLRSRIAHLRDCGLVAMEVVMSPETWDRLKREYRARTPGLHTPIVSSRDVLGLRNKLLPGVKVVIIRYFGGADFPPGRSAEQASLSPSKLKRVGPPAANHARPLNERQGELTLAQLAVLARCAATTSGRKPNSCGGGRPGGRTPGPALRRH
jgi:hypothetical protein